MVNNSAYQTPTVADFQRNLDAIIHSGQQEVRKARGQILSQQAAKGLARSGSTILAFIENADGIHKSIVELGMNLIDEFAKAPSQLSRKILADTARPRLESLAILLANVPDFGSPPAVQQIRAQYAAVFQQRLDGALKDIEIGFINGRTLSAAQDTEGGKVLDHMLGDRVTLVKKDGTVQREDVPSLVMRGKIQIHDASLPIEVGDHILRQLPNGLAEDYIVDDPVLHSGLGQKYFTVHVHKSSAPTAQKGLVVQNITNNLHGPHSRVNFGSTDNSANVSSEIGIDKLLDFLNQIRSAIGGLPVMQQQAIATPLAQLEDEVQSGTPSKSVVAVALQSIKTVAEGASGNLIASGIVGLIHSLMS